MQSDRSYVYLGPNIPGGMLWTGNIFKNEYPKHLNELFEETPEIKELFAEVKDVPKFKQKLSIKGTEENRLYTVVEIKMREGVK